MKRGDSGLSLLVAIDKPVGMSSHDVVNRVRRIFGEKRVGHTGTLDPMASGVLPICVGPATRLDKYMTSHDKRYRVDIAFGFETTTDDAEGEPTVYGKAKVELLDEDFVRAFLVTILGEHDQVPPQYSAIKVNGKKAYQVARGGGQTELQPRRITVFDADLYSCHADPEAGFPVWSVDFSVSKGTYIRALARDVGRAVNCPAHVSALRRLSAGAIGIDDCVSLQTLESQGANAALDPVAVLGYRYAFADSLERQILAGSKIGADDLTLLAPLTPAMSAEFTTCTSRVVKSVDAPVEGELVCVVVGNKLKALYAYTGNDRAWKPACVFATPIARGASPESD